MRILLIASFVIIALTLVVSYFVVRSIRPLGQTAAALASAADGITAVAVKLGDQSIEASRKAAALEEASRQISATIGQLSVAADGISASIQDIQRNSADATKVATSAAQLG